MNINSKEILKDCFGDLENINYFKINSSIGGNPFLNLIIGKAINFNIIFKNFNAKFSIGTLAQIKEFYNSLKRFLVMAIINKILDKVI